MEVNVRISRLRKASSDIERTASAIRKISDSIESVKNNLDSSSGAYAVIRTKLRSMQTNARLLADNAALMGRNLEAVAETYNSTEKEIVSSANGIRPSLFDIIEKESLNMTAVAWQNAISHVPGINVIGSIMTGLPLGWLQLITSPNNNGHLWSDLFQGSLEGQAEGTLFDEDGHFDPMFHAVASGEFTALQLDGAFNSGLASGAASLAVGSVAAMGAVNGSLFDEDGKLSPKLSAKAHAEAVALEVSADTKFGTDDVNIHADAEGKVMGAEADAALNISSEGIDAKVGGEAYVAKGSVSGGINLFGIQISAEASGSIGASASASASVTGTSISGEIGACLGIGGGVALSIDWSGFKNPFENLSWGW